MAANQLTGDDSALPRENINLAIERGVNVTQTQQTAGIFLRPLVQMLRHQGVDADSLLLDHQIEPHAVANPEARIEASHTSRLLDHAVALLDDP